MQLILRIVKDGFTLTVTNETQFQNVTYCLFPYKREINIQNTIYINQIGIYIWNITILQMHIPC